MTPFQRLMKRLRDDGHEFSDLTLCRTYAGYWQRSAGAWSWWAQDEAGREVLGSHFTVTELLKADFIDTMPAVGSPALDLFPRWVTMTDIATENVTVVRTVPGSERRGQPASEIG